MMKEKNTPHHNSGIDILRGISILSVILLHLNTRIPFSQTLLGGSIPPALYKILFWSGYYGVCIFFVVSGFLITTSSLNKWNFLPEISLKGFYSMRFARIMPLLAGLLIVLSILHLTGVTGFVINPKQTSLGRAVIAALTFHINWLEIKVGYLPGSWDILWSLSIEEFFYFFFPLVCLVCRKEWHFIAIVSVFMIISPLARTIWMPGNELADKNHLAYLDAISLGCMAAIVARRIDLKRYGLMVTAAVGWSLFILVMILRQWVSMMGLSKIGLNVTLLVIGTALILIWMQKRMADGRQNPSRLSVPIRFLGRNSYEIYLTHMFVIVILIQGYSALRLSGEWTWMLYLSSIMVSGIVGELTARYFSSPMNRLLRQRIGKMINH